VTDAGPPSEGSRHEFTRHEFTVSAAGSRLDLLVAAHVGLSRTQAATLIATGHVLVNGRPERASHRADPGAIVVVEVPPPPGRTVTPEDIPLSIVYEDDALLVVDKPAGMVVHPAPGHWSGTLANALVGRGAEWGEFRGGIVHRLDKETSGLLLVAKTEPAHQRLSAALASRQVRRQYAVLVWGHLDGDHLTVDQPIGRDPRDRKRMAIVSSGRSARTDFVRLARYESVDLLRARLHTGRTHQIRVHLASVGHPVVGDDTYGGGGARRLVELPPHRHFLHAAWLRFRHPITSAVMDLRAPLPADLRRSLAAVSGDEQATLAPDALTDVGFYSARDSSGD
jgi:23S rRNA pseudouridine1911/1915/1917 synthase